MFSLFVCVALLKLFGLLYFWWYYVDVFCLCICFDTQEFIKLVFVLFSCLARFVLLGVVCLYWFVLFTFVWIWLLCLLLCFGLLYVFGVWCLFSIWEIVCFCLLALDGFVAMRLLSWLFCCVGCLICFVVLADVGVTWYCLLVTVLCTGILDVTCFLRVLVFVFCLFTDFGILHGFGLNCNNFNFWVFMMDCLTYFAIYWLLWFSYWRLDGW